MATGEGSPLRQGAGTGSRLVFGGYRGFGGGTPDLLCSPIVLGYMDIYIGGRNTSGEPQGAHEGGGRAQGGGRAPCLVPPSFLS